MFLIHLIRITLYFSPILCAFCLTQELSNNRLEKVKESQLEFVKGTSYLFKRVENVSKLKCAARCFSYAEKYTMICAGVHRFNEGRSCLLLFPDTLYLNQLKKTNGSRLMNQGTIYLYKPHIGKINT